jgi:hypothetical protein
MDLYLYIGYGSAAVMECGSHAAVAKQGLRNPLGLSTMMCRSQRGASEHMIDV